jgi:dGTPase
MREFGGFEHNLQSLRVVDEIEDHYASFPGLNLTFECREGILKHCSQSNARLLGEIGERFLRREQPGLEAQLANLADEVAYNNHDIDDGVRAGLITVEQLLQTKLFGEQHQQVIARYPDLSGRRLVHEVVRGMIDYVVNDVITTSRIAIESTAPTTIDEVRRAGRPLIGFSTEARTRQVELKSFLREHVYRHYKVQRMTSKARRVVRELFGAFVGDMNLMPPEHCANAAKGLEMAGEAGKARAVADYIAGMTDRYAILEHERLFNPAERT